MAPPDAPSPFTFTGTASPAAEFLLDLVEEEREVQAAAGDWPALTRADLARVAELSPRDLGTVEECIDLLAGGGEAPAPVYSFAACAELARLDPTFWKRLRELGATPALVRQANALLRKQRPRRADSTTAKVTAPARLRRSCGARSRTSRGTPRRRAGSRRGSAGSDDDGGGGGSDPALALRRKAGVG